MIAYFMSNADATSSDLWGKVAGQQIADECGTGGLNTVARTAHLLETVEAMEQDFAGFVREMEARSGDDQPD